MSIKKYDNQANIFGTNIFETCTGALNIAPIKISGQYKIVVCLDGNLYLDDYTGRKVIIDKSRNFLSQVSKFLKIQTTIVDNSILKYGAFQKSTKKYYHIPLYLGSINNNLPKYFVLSRVVNETITNIDNLYKYGKIQQIIDLDKIGLTNIFNEIISEKHFDYPIYFNFDESNISIFGYSIKNDIELKHTFDLNNSQTNQPYFEVLNNNILNTFVKQQMFFPKFINIEFEFEYSNEYQIFNNFYGYLSNSNEINFNKISDIKNYNIKLQDYKNTIIWKQQVSTDEFILNKYLDVIDNGSIQEINEQLPQIRFSTSNISINDKITIKHPNNDIIFQYVIKNTDIINESLYQTFKNICKSATKESKNNFIFSVIELSDKSCIIKIIMNLHDILCELYTIELPIQYKNIDRFLIDDNFNKFRGINSNDVWLCGKPNLLNNITQIKIENKQYNIIEKFKFDDKTIIRLDTKSNITKLSECIIYQDKYEKLIELNPISLLNYNSTLTSYLPFDQQKYVDELSIKFDSNNNQLVKDSINLFNINKEISSFQYINDNKIEIDDSNIVIQDIDYNNDICMNMLFASIGQTTYLTPNILNIDKKFYVQNGNIDTNKLNNDSLRFNWFLIKGICPDYLKSDIRELRYFTIEPKITSTLIKITEEYCETIFLGVKYQLPIKYVDFQFATYLNFNKQSDINVNYKFDVNNENKTIYLSINKYLDFNDLLRGGNNSEPLLDLSLFYSINNSFNSTSEYVTDFVTSSIKLCIDFEINEQPILFESTPVYDWKYKTLTNEYIALRLNNFSENNINDFNVLFTTGVEGNFYVYSKIVYNNIEYTYCSMSVRLSNIVDVKEKYLWCENIYIKFFDTDIIKLQRFDNVLNKIVFIDVDKNSLIIDNSSVNNIFDYIKKTTILNDSNIYDLILPNTEISIKDYYFSIEKTITQNTLGEKTINKKVFTFSDNILNLTDDEIILTFDNDETYSTIINESDKIISHSKISLFNRNQLWNIIQSLFKTDLKFKNASKELIKKYINKLMIINLIDYSTINFLPVNNSDEFINLKINDIDRNIVVWNLQNNNKIVMINRFRTAYLPYMELFNNEIEFQLNNLKKFNSLFNIYDKNFGGLGISATGIWKEVQGNLVSSLFCKEENIVITIPFESQIDYKKLIISTLNIDDLIITDLNSNYIEIFNKNINEYILESYCNYLLLNFYNLDSVINEYGQKLLYTIDNKISTLIYFKDTTIYIQDFNKLTFIFKRK